MFACVWTLRPVGKWGWWWSLMYATGPRLPGPSLLPLSKVSVVRIVENLIRKYGRTCRALRFTEEIFNHSWRFFLIVLLSIFDNQAQSGGNNRNFFSSFKNRERNVGNTSYFYKSLTIKHKLVTTNRTSPHF